MVFQRFAKESLNCFSRTCSPSQHQVLTTSHGRRIGRLAQAVSQVCRELCRKFSLRLHSIDQLIG